MRSYWFWFGWLAAVWASSLWQIGVEQMTWGLFGCAGFLGAYFLLPLARRPLPKIVLLTFALLVAAVTFHTMIHIADEPVALAFHALFIILYLVGEAGFRLDDRLAIVYAAVSATVLALLLASHTDRLEFDGWMMFAILLVSASAPVLIALRNGRKENEETRRRYELLENEYRRLKRSAHANEEATRLAERTAIARQIHDSVGHKLTALMMQLEVFRMRLDGDERQSAEALKQLARDSLEETRRAVHSLNEPEIGGIPALTRLIRNLEAENFMNIEFMFRHGALSAELSNEQSIAVYRAIQEALTNVMRHGASRWAEVMLESPGGRVFRFEVVSETGDEDETQIRPGFGLSAMKDRVEQAGGRLELIRENKRFIVRGTFSLEVV